MTDRIDAITVYLAKDVRDDDITSLTTAILQFRNVLSVDVHIADFSSSHVAKLREQHRFYDLIYKALLEGMDG